MEAGRRSLSWPGDEEGQGWGLLSLAGSCGVGAGQRGRTGELFPSAWRGRWGSRAASNILGSNPGFSGQAGCSAAQTPSPLIKVTSGDCKPDFRGFREFPGGPVVKAPPPHLVGAGSISA